MRKISRFDSFFFSSHGGEIEIFFKKIERDVVGMALALAFERDLFYLDIPVFIFVFLMVLDLLLEIFESSFSVFFLFFFSLSSSSSSSSSSIDVFESAQVCPFIMFPTFTFPASYSYLPHLKRLTCTQCTHCGSCGLVRR